MANNYDNIITIKFARAEQPKFEERNTSSGKYVEFGEKNNYPDYILGLYKESAKHGAIINSKTTYIYGKGFQVDGQANPGETWNEVMKKCVLDNEIFGGYYIQVVYNRIGGFSSAFHIPFKKVRVNKDINEYFVKDKWDDSREKARIYKPFDPSNTGDGSQIYAYRQYNPDADCYPYPGYFHGLNYIESDVQISRHILGNAKDGFVATTVINLNGGEPGEEQKAAVEKGLKKKFTGSEGDRVVIMFNKSKDNESTVSPLPPTMLTKEDFTNINNLVQQEIYACHCVTSPTLFGISTPGALGQRNEIQDAYEIFNNTYVNERQQEIEKCFSELMAFAGVQTSKIIPVKPLGLMLTPDQLIQILPKQYFFDELGIDPKYLTPDAGQIAGQPAPTPQVAVANDHLKNLTGRQHQNIMRIVRQFASGKITKEQAALMLKGGYAFTDEDVNTFLGLDSAAFGTDDDIYVEFSGGGDTGYEELHFLSDVEKQVVAVMEDKNITDPGEIATEINRPVSEVNTAIETLTNKGYIGAEAVDVMIRYKYAWRDIVPADQRNTAAHPSREFCVKMMELSQTKTWSNADIENISSRLGYSVFDRVGGWWTMPDGTASPQCRHEWKAVIVKKKK